MVRSTWLAEARLFNIQTHFLLAASRSRHVQQIVDDEITKYNDIIQFDDFVDDYHNLSLKTAAMFKYHAERYEEPLKQVSVSDVQLFFYSFVG